MPGYRFLPEARNELAATVGYYDREFPDLGQVLAREAQRLCNLITASPLAGHEVRPGIRRRMLRRFPYTILNALDGTEILIIAVTHQRRRPAYWRDRLSFK